MTKLISLLSLSISILFLPGYVISTLIPYLHTPSSVHITELGILRLYPKYVTNNNHFAALHGFKNSFISSLHVHSYW